MIAIGTIASIEHGQTLGQIQRSVATEALGSKGFELFMPQAVSESQPESVVRAAVEVERTVGLESRAAADQQKRDVGQRMGVAFTKFVEPDDLGVVEQIASHAAGLGNFRKTLGKVRQLRGDCNTTRRASGCDRRPATSSTRPRTLPGNAFFGESNGATRRTAPEFGHTLTACSGFAPFGAAQYCTLIE